jgi:hypothetical protein
MVVDKLGGGGEMIPGRTTKLTEARVASAATISAKTDIILVTGAVQINNILPNFGGGVASGMVILIPVDGAITLGTTGNIAVGIAAVINRAVWLVYVKSLNKWVINSGV